MGNQVTLYSNGIGHFRRVYSVPATKSLAISIPFGQNDIGDVLASLQVIGNVKYVSPPSFAPNNSNTTNLQILPNEGMRGLLKALSGAKIQIGTSTHEYTLVGIETVVNSKGNPEDYLVAISDGRINRVELNEVSGITFLEETVKAEISKALANSYRKIKPHSTYLDLVLAGLDVEGENADESAEVQYAIPVAVWKMRYAIRKMKNNFFLEGTAIIDNNTDEDWNDFTVSVATGDPISFSTDLADIVVPTRQFVSVVPRTVQGYVQDEATYEHSPVRCASSRGMVAKSAMYTNDRTMTGNYGSFGMSGPQGETGAQGYQGFEAYSNALMAETPGVEAKDVGDFCVFTAKEPISIASKRSAVVTMFTVPLTQAGSVLLYKPSAHSRRPFRAVKFKNETEFTLGRGKVTIYEDEVFQGEAMIEAAKPSENRMLAYCVENAVKVLKKDKKHETTQTSIEISNGVLLDEKSSKAVTTYQIENRKDEDFKFILDHTRLFVDGHVEFTGVENLTTELTMEGVRAYFVLKAKEKVTLTAIDRTVVTSKITLKGMKEWLVENIIESEHSLLSDKGVQKCVAQQKKIDKVNEEISVVRARAAELERQTKRVQENVKATSQDGGSPIRQAWLKDLNASEEEIRKIEKEIMPDLNKKLKDANGDLRKALKELSVKWKTE
jgi:hypothetical protein